jgi:hypothetical protein
MVKVVILRSVEGEGIRQDGSKLIPRVIDGLKIYGAL